MDLKSIVDFGQGVLRDKDFDVRVRVRKREPERYDYSPIYNVSTLSEGRGNGPCRECREKDYEISDLKAESRFADCLWLVIVFVAVLVSLWVGSRFL